MRLKQLQKILSLFIIKNIYDGYVVLHYTLRDDLKTAHHH